MNVRENTTLCDSYTAEQLVELFVVADRELEVAWVDPGFLVVPGRVSGELEDLSGQVLEDSGSINGGGSSDSGVGCDSALQESVDSSHGELY